MINKNKWVLVWNGINNKSITFKQDVREDYNLIDIRAIDNNKDEQALSIYIVGKGEKKFIFNNRQYALKYLFDKYSFLKEMKGDHVKHTPMYPNFPKQVMEMEFCDLYRNAMMHYWTADRKSVV